MGGKALCHEEVRDVIFNLSLTLSGDEPSQEVSERVLQRMNMLYDELVLERGWRREVNPGVMNLRLVIPSQDKLEPTG